MQSKELGCVIEFQMTLEGPFQPTLFCDSDTEKKYSERTGAYFSCFLCHLLQVGTRRLRVALQGRGRRGCVLLSQQPDPGRGPGIQQRC